jgi:hypothetical protein
MVIHVNGDEYKLLLKNLNLICPTGHRFVSLNMKKSEEMSGKEVYFCTVVMTENPVQEGLIRTGRLRFVIFCIEKCY